MFQEYSVKGAPAPIAGEDVDALASRLGVQLPAGYRDFMTRFGKGDIACYVRIYPPAEITDSDNSVEAWRERVDRYWFWDQGADILSKAKALECVIIADTFDGDEVVFHPTEPDRLYILPRYSEKIYAVDGGVEAMVEWLCGSGVLTEKITSREFDPA